MARRDLARERLAEIRTLQGWREAYKVAGLTDEGSDATKRRRLSRLINRKTSGAKRLDAKERRKINAAYKRPRRTEALRKGRVDRHVKEVNRLRAEARRNVRSIYGAGGTSPDPQKLKRRLAKYRNLSAEEVERLDAAFASAADDSGKGIRRSYASMLKKTPINLLPPSQRAAVKAKQTKADRAVWRDKGRPEPFKKWEKTSSENKYGE